MRRNENQIRANLVGRLANRPLGATCDREQPGVAHAAIVAELPHRFTQPGLGRGVERGFPFIELLRRRVGGRFVRGVVDMEQHEIGIEPPGDGQGAGQ